MVAPVGVIDVVDAIRHALDGITGLGLVWDDTAAQPFEWRDDHVYAWAESTQETSIGTGEVRQDFEIMIVAVLDHEGEEAQLRRNRDTSVRLDRIRAEYMQWIRLHPHVPPWDSGNLAARSEEDFLRQLEVRGVAVRVGGYRLVSE